MKRNISKGQDPLKLRLGGYGPMGDQLGSLWKIIEILLEDASPATLAKINARAPDAIESLEKIKNCKKKFPKRKGKPNDTV